MQNSGAVDRAMPATDARRCTRRRAASTVAPAAAGHTGCTSTNDVTTKPASVAATTPTVNHGIG